jgi:dihydroneopterin aldolase
MPDRIDLLGIEVHARHGVLPAEKSEPQPFLVDVSIALDLTGAGASDDLEGTIDYGVLAKQVHDFVEDSSFNLIEGLADQLAAMILEYELVESVAVTVHKPEAPIAVPFGDVSVTVHRSR